MEGRMNNHESKNVFTSIRSLRYPSAEKSHREEEGEKGGGGGEAFLLYVKFTAQPKKMNLTRKPSRHF